MEVGATFRDSPVLTESVTSVDSALNRPLNMAF